MVKILSIILTLALSATLLEGKILEEISAQELILENGIKVYLKEVPNDDEMIYIQMAAPLGYSSLKKEDQMAAQMAPNAAWYSQIGDLDSPNLSSLLYNESIDFNYFVEEHYRYITGEAYSNNSDKLLKLLFDFFRDPHFTEKGIKELINDELDSLKNQKQDPYELVERKYYELNGIPWSGEKKLSQIMSFTKEKAAKCFKLLYGHPEEFALVITGDFDIEKIKDQLDKTIGTLKKGTGEKLEAQAILTTPIKEGKITLLKEKKGWGKTDYQTRITFQIPFHITLESFIKLEFLTQALEVELREMIKRRTGNTAGVDVSLILPLYPLFIDPWFVIQFELSSSLSEKMGGEVKEYLLKIQKEGISEIAIETSLKNMASSDEFWEKEPIYWLNSLTNDFLFKWDPIDVFKAKKKLLKAPKEPLDALLKEMNFTQLTLFITNVSGE